VQRGARQANGARLAAHLGQAGKHVLDACTRLGDATIRALGSVPTFGHSLSTDLTQAFPACACRNPSL
jgi:hypothetical protein